MLALKPGAARPTLAKPSTQHSRMICRHGARMMVRPVIAAIRLMRPWARASTDCQRVASLLRPSRLILITGNRLAKTNNSPAVIDRANNCCTLRWRARASTAPQREHWAVWPLPSGTDSYSESQCSQMIQLREIVMVFR